MRAKPDAKVMSVDEAAAALGLDRKTIYEGIKRGQIPSIQVGRRIVVPRPAFERLLERGAPDAVAP